RRHRADRQRPLDPGPDEVHFIVEPNAFIALELLDRAVDLFADAVALLLEQPELAPDLAFDDSFPDFQETKLPPDLLFELLQGRQRHESHTKTLQRFCTRQIDGDFKTFGRQRPYRSGGTGAA